MKQSQSGTAVLEPQFSAEHQHLRRHVEASSDRDAEGAASRETGPAGGKQPPAKQSHTRTFYGSLSGTVANKHVCSEGSIRVKPGEIIVSARALDKGEQRRCLAKRLAMLLPFAAFSAAALASPRLVSIGGTLAFVGVYIAFLSWVQCRADANPPGRERHLCVEAHSVERLVLTPTPASVCILRVVGRRWTEAMVFAFPQHDEAHLCEAFEAEWGARFADTGTSRVGGMRREAVFSAAAAPGTEVS